MKDSPAKEWYLNETYAGTWQTARNLTYVRVSLMIGLKGSHSSSSVFRLREALIWWVP